MKNHLVIWVDNDAAIGRIPHWGDIIADKSLPSSSFLPQITEIFDKHGLPARYLREYKPRKEDWSDDELRSNLHKMFRIVLKDNRDFPSALLQEMSILPGIKKIEQGSVSFSHVPTFTKSLTTAGSQPSEQIYLDTAHFFTKGHPSVKVAVLDTGVDYSHPEIAHAMEPGKDFVDISGEGAGPASKSLANMKVEDGEGFIGDFKEIDDDPYDEVGHGTHICGIIAAKGTKMEKGVAPRCRIIPVRVLGALKRGNSVVGAGIRHNINNGIKWAVDQGADIINMSLGIKHASGGLPHEEVIKYALDRGVSIVAASGNDGARQRYYPGALPGVIAVGAVDSTDRLAPFSTFGNHVSFVAPGVNIISTFPKHKYSMSSGTSQAAPYVTGVIALLKSYGLKLGIDIKDNHVKYLLKNTADRNGTHLKKIKSGYGRINALDALKLLRYKAGPK